MTAPTGTIVCPRCGERLPQGFTRCDACGAYLVPAGEHAPDPGPYRDRGRGRRAPAAHAAQKSRGGSPWIFLLIGLVLGGAVGYALRGAVGPRAEEGGMPTGPADVMSGTAGAGAQMPPEVVAEIARYRQALARDPSDPEANVGLGNLLFDSGQYAKAIERYTKALEKVPGNPDVRVDRAIAYHHTNQSDQAKEELLRVTREHPEHVNAWLNLGVVSATLGDRATAIRAWEQYLKLEPGGAHAASIREELENLKKGS